MSLEETIIFAMIPLVQEQASEESDGHGLHLYQRGVDG